MHGLLRDQLGDAPPMLEDQNPAERIQMAVLLQQAAPSHAPNVPA
jgi:hypothetical protein